jgi:hypothetical protein
MAESKKIMIDVEVNTSGGLEGVNKGIDETKQRVKSLKTETDKTSKAMQNGFKAGADAASIIPGPIGQAASAMQGLTGGIGKVVGAFGSLKGALIASGIGAFVVVVGTLISYFTQTEAGAQKLRVIMAGLGAAVRVVSDAMIGLLQGLKQIASGDISGGIDKIGDSFSNLGSKITESTKAAVELETAMNKVLQAEDDLKVKRAESNTEIAKARMLADDLTLSTNERIAAVKRAGEIEAEVAGEEQKIAAERLRILREQMALKKDASEEERDAVDDAQVRLIELERETTMRQKRLGTEIQGLRNEQSALDKERHATDLAAIQARYDEELRIAQEAADAKLTVDDYLAERRAVTAEEQLALDIEKALAAEDAKFNAVMEALFQQDATKAEYEEAQYLYEQEQMQIKNDLQYEFDQKNLERIQANEDAATKIEQDAAAKRLANEAKINAARISAATNVAGALGAIGKLMQQQGQENTAAAKTLAVAEIAINTAVAIAGAVKTATNTSNPWEMIAAIAAGIAAVVAGMTAATSVLDSADVPGPSAAGAVSSVAASAPQITPVTTNTTQLGNTQQAELAPVQAYVVETQITGAQTNINQIESQSTFGGG